MIFSRKTQGVLIGLVIFLIGIIKTWPLPLEPNVLNSLKIYSTYVFGGQARISDLLGSVDIACAVGPFDSFRDERFSKILTEEQIVAAENALAKQNKISLGDNQLFVVGLRDARVAAIYASNFFSNLKTLDRATSTTVDCVGGSGFISPEKFNNVISIKLKEGV